MSRRSPYPRCLVTLILMPLACTLQAEPSPDYLEDYLPVDNALVVGVPDAVRDADDPSVKRGQYLVSLLGCGSCHTDGALLGAPDNERALAGSTVGIAISDPMRNRYPAIVYPPNITPDDDTGIGTWTESELARLLRDGMDRHGGRALPVMPWQNYARLTSADALAVARFLKSIQPVNHRVPRRVREGTPAPAPYVHVGLYQRRD